MYNVIYYFYYSNHLFTIIILLLFFIFFNLKRLLSILLYKNSTIKYFQNADYLNLNAFNFLISSSDNKYFSG